MSGELRLLGAQDAEATYPLAYAEDPSTRLDQWRARLSRRPGLGGAYGWFSKGLPDAVLAYSLARTAEGQDLFVIETLSAFDLTEPARKAARLLDAVLDTDVVADRQVVWAATSSRPALLIPAVAALQSVF